MFEDQNDRPKSKIDYEVVTRTNTEINQI